MLRIIAALFIVAGLLTACDAQTGLSTEVRENIQRRIDNGINTGIVVGILDDDSVKYYSFGVRSLDTKDRVDENSVFEIGSISKTFTGIILADRVIRGKMKLDDPLQKYLPDGVTAPARNAQVIRLVHLANHTSSLPRMPDNFTPANPSNPYADYSQKQLYEFLQNHQLTRDIGSRYEYSNYAMGLLGNILAAHEGVTYEQLMVDVIAGPLQLSDTRIALTPKMKTNLAMGHDHGAQVENWDIPAMAGAGAIRSTAVDMMRYIAANMGKVKSKLYPAMQLAHRNSRADAEAPVVGLGWHTTSANGVEIVWHNGGTGGYRTFAGFINGGERGVVVLSNSTASVDDIGFHLLNPASPLTDPKPVPVSNVPDVEVKPEVLETYAGKYELMPGFVLTVTRDGSQLKAQATGQPQFPVFARAENVFYYKVVEAQLTFNRNPAGAVESVTLHQNGQSLVGKKLPNQGR